MGGELQSVGLDARVLLQAAPRQCHCLPCASCMAMGRSHLSTAHMEVNDKQCARTMETGRARPRLVSIHDRTRMCNAIGEATTTCQQPHQC